MTQRIKGFSKLSREEKVDLLIKHYRLSPDLKVVLERYRHRDDQPLFDEFSENTLSNFFLPFGVAPNFKIDGKDYVVPMVTEESSVVAAASRAASFWAQHGGFVTTIHQTLKMGHIWFRWNGPASLLSPLPDGLEDHLKKAVASLTANMTKRGGGITKIELIASQELTGLFQLQVYFKTADSMGANFINSCLEEMREPLVQFFVSNRLLKHHTPPEILMAILSNYTPECLVSCSVSCPIEELEAMTGPTSTTIFAQRFKTAIDIAWHDTSRAVTHNKGILNGTDAVVIATGNDFRAVEADIHAFAARDGQYRSLSQCHLTEDGQFTFEVTLPLALGTVGGLTTLHPLAAEALEMLNNPTSSQLMSIAAATGLANHFSAITSLITTGIQKGHMKLHLNNLLNTLDADQQEKDAAHRYFRDRKVTARSVKTFLTKRRESTHPAPKN